MIKINILHKGDEVLSVNSDFIAIRRKNGEVDIIPLVKDNNLLRVDLEGIVTIGYGNNEVVHENESGLKITTF